MSDPRTSDHSAAVAVEISAELAEKSEAVLRGFAEEAELDTVLIVTRSGALVSGISSQSSVDVDVISALVAGASGAVQALIKQLGEQGAIESIHQGSERLLYLHDLIGRFILVAVTESEVPAGLVRQLAVPVRAELAGLFAEFAQIGEEGESTPEEGSSPHAIDQLEVVPLSQKEEEEHEAEDVESDDELESPEAISPEKRSQRISGMLRGATATSTLTVPLIQEEAQVPAPDPDPADFIEEETPIEEASAPDEAGIPPQTGGPTTGELLEERVENAVRERLEKVNLSAPDENETPAEVSPPLAAPPELESIEEAAEAPAEPTHRAPALVEEFVEPPPAAENQPQRSSRSYSKEDESVSDEISAPTEGDEEHSAETSPVEQVEASGASVSDQIVVTNSPFEMIAGPPEEEEEEASSPSSDAESAAAADVAEAGVEDVEEETEIPDPILEDLGASWGDIEVVESGEGSGNGESTVITADVAADSESPFEMVNEETSASEASDTNPSEQASASQYPGTFAEEIDEEEAAQSAREAEKPLPAISGPKYSFELD